MRLIEAEGKALLARRGIATPSPARLYRAGEIIDAAAGAVAIKAQILSGKRAESGLIVLTAGADAPTAASQVLSLMTQRREVPLVLVEAQVHIKSEYYLAWRIDDLSKAYVMMFSLAGGANIEQRRDTVHQYAHSPLVELQPYHIAPLLQKAGLPASDVGPVARFAVRLFGAFREEEAVLLEINPLVITHKGGVVAVDAKVVLDDNAEKRHLDWVNLVSAKLQASERSELEAIAADENTVRSDARGPVGFRGQLHRISAGLASGGVNNVEHFV